ncbi:hypothetical protein ACGFYZ_20000 [Streptomyces sp. NPDC048330]|uniref:hypothetical protein n=1 Tax=Streptomyces sp. NPDC048330 TaxID=3365533 RepID=UPI00371CFEAB
MRALAALPLFESKPAAATIPKDFREVASGCEDDSGDAWLSAERTYAFPGTRAEVIQYYRTAAERDGWKLEEDPGPSPVPEEKAGLCFTRGGEGEAMMLMIYFMTPRDLAIEGYAAGPEFASGSGFRLAVGSEADGAPTGCWD